MEAQCEYLKKKLHHHKTKSYELQVQSNSTLFVLFNCHQLNAARHCPQPRLSIILVGADCWGARTVRSCDVHTHTHKKKTYKGPKDGAVVIRLCWQVRWEEMSERSISSVGEGRDHLSATAAAIGTRILPRAVAANSSISVFNRLMTHSIASRPWRRQRNSVTKHNV